MRRWRLTRPGETLLTKCVRLAMPTVVARQPLTSGESSINTPRTPCGCCAAVITLKMPPSEWPTKNTGSPASCTCWRVKSANCCTKCGQLLVTGYCGSWPKRSTALTVKPRWRKCANSTL